MIDPLAARLRRIEDRLALHDLVARYCVLIDDDRFDDLAALFTDDVDFAGAVGRGGGVGRLRAAPGPVVVAPSRIPVHESPWSSPSSTR